MQIERVLQVLSVVCQNPMRDQPPFSKPLSLAVKHANFHKMVEGTCFSNLSLYLGLLSFKERMYRTLTGVLQGRAEPKTLGTGLRYYDRHRVIDFYALSNYTLTAKVPKQQHFGSLGSTFLGVYTACSHGFGIW